MAVILIVDDEFFIREFTISTVEELGYETISAGDVEEAMFHIRSHQQIDALVTDVRLKKAINGGHELAHEAIKIRPDLRVIYSTGNAITDQAKALFVEGAHFLQKPYSPDQLKNALETLLPAAL